VNEMRSPLAVVKGGSRYSQRSSPAKTRSLKPAARRACAVVPGINVGVCGVAPTCCVSAAVTLVECEKRPMKTVVHAPIWDFAGHPVQHSEAQSKYSHAVGESDGNPFRLRVEKSRLLVEACPACAEGGHTDP